MFLLIAKFVISIMNISQKLDYAKKMLNIL